MVSATARAPAAERRRTDHRAGTPLRGLLPLAAGLGVWQVLGDPGSPFFPTPASWVGAVADLWRAGDLLPAVLATLRTLSIALVVATVLGVALGILVGASRLADRALNPTFEFARAMPPAAMVPVAALLLGFDETMKVTVVTIAALWAILLNTRAGVRGLDPTLLDAARTLRLGTLARLRKVVVPALLPAIFVGVRVAAPIVVVITLLVEILTQVNGVGALIAHAQQTFQPRRVYGLIVVAGLLSLLINLLVSAAERSLLRWRT